MGITFPRVRDVVMLLLGAGGMVRDLYLIDSPNVERVWVEIGLLLGPAALNFAWRARNTPPVEPTQTSPSSSPSSWPSPR